MKFSEFPIGQRFRFKSQKGLDTSCFLKDGFMTYQVPGLKEPKIMEDLNTEVELCPRKHYD